MNMEALHEEPDDEVDLRSAIEDAYDDAEEGRPAEDAEEPVRSAVEETEEGPGQDSATTGRDERGRFTKTKLTEVPTEPTGDGTVTPEETPEPESGPDPLLKAPASWKPGARESWGALAPEVKAEVHRREREAAQLMERTTTARRVYDHMSGLQQKYAPALQAEGVDVVQATENLMGMAATMRFGTPLEKAQTAAQIIHTYGVDILALDTLLANGPPQGQQSQGQQAQTDPRVDQLFQKLEQAQSERINQVQQQATTEVEQFIAKHEFGEDLREEMADLLEVAAKRGIDLSLEDAYNRACQLSPEISKVLAARTAAQQAGTRKGSTRRARAAASSIHGKPSKTPPKEPDTLRESIEAAFDESNER